VQKIREGDKDGAIKVHNLMGVRYVPLVKQDIDL
jgi:hypothetical protein